MKNESVNKSLEKSKNVLEEKCKIVKQKICLNIAGRLPEKTRNRFVDRQSKKTVKKRQTKKFVFSLRADLLYFD